MEETNFGEEEKKISKINAAALINLTLERLWANAFNKQASGNLLGWNRCLDSLWLILGGDEDDDSIYVKEFNKIEIEIGNSGSLIHKKTGFALTSQDENKLISYQYRLLMKKSLFLRRLQNKQGKGTAYEDYSSDYMEV